MLPQQYRLPCLSMTLTVPCEGQRSSVLLAACFACGCFSSFALSVIFCPDLIPAVNPRPAMSVFSVGDVLFCLGSFLELQFPQRSKFLRTGAFVLPFLFDSVPLFYRVSVGTSALADRQTLYSHLSSVLC